MTPMRFSRAFAVSSSRNSGRASVSSFGVAMTPPARFRRAPKPSHPPVRPSRLFTSTAKYVLLQGANVLRITALYKPLKIFSIAAGVFLGAGALLGLRFLGFYFFGTNPGGHVQSLILSAILILIGFLTLSIGLVADLVAINRRLLEEMKLTALSSQLSASEERSRPRG